MAPPIGSVGGPRGTRRIRGKRAGESAPASAAGFTESAAGAAPIPPGDLHPKHAAPAVSAQLMGQSDSAEDAPPAKSAARSAARAYLKVEWSGRRDRRARRGRIAKTEV